MEREYKKAIEVGTHQLIVNYSKCSCGKVSNRKCSRCQAKYYCSEKCQKADWHVHKTKCIPFKEVSQEELNRQYEIGKKHGLDYSPNLQDIPEKNLIKIMTARNEGAETRNKKWFEIKKHVYDHWKYLTDIIINIGRKNKEIFSLHIRVVDKENLTMVIFYVPSTRRLYLVYSDQPEGVYKAICKYNDYKYYLNADSIFIDYTDKCIPEEGVFLYEEPEYVDVCWDHGIVIE